MINGFLRNKIWPIALDIGADGVKMLQMRQVGPTVRVSASGRWRMPISGDPDPERVREQLIEAVREMLRGTSVRGRRVVSSLSCDQVQIKNIRLPHMSGNELDQAVWSEARQRFNFDVAPDRVRYINAGQVRQGTEMRDEIIMLAVSGEVIESHLSMLDAMGLTPERISVTPVAMFHGYERFLKRKSDEEAVAVLVDMGRSGTRVVVARGRNIIFIKSIDIGGRKLDEAVAGQLGISEEEASELRMRIMQERAFPSDDGQGTDAQTQGVDLSVRDGLRAEAEALAKEMALCLRYCAVTFRGLRPGRVTLMGGEAYDPAVRDLLYEQLGIECVLGHPLKGIDVSGADLGSDRRATLVEWSVCAGLAAGATELQGQAYDIRHERDRLSA